MTGKRRIRLGRCDVFGEIAPLTGVPHTADVQALGYCHILMLTRDDFHNLLADDPDLKAQMDKVAREYAAMNATSPSLKTPPPVSPAKQAIQADARRHLLETGSNG